MTLTIVNDPLKTILARLKQELKRHYGDRFPKPSAIIRAFGCKIFQQAEDLIREISPNKIEQYHYRESLCQTSK
ncbi:MAG: hypothetical protein ACK5QJ_16745 [Microcystis sp.]|jgi:hypothetical protein|uniref:hypothetical protein n=1 Tax=Microcystis TaxID=1125 RepID=UPI0022C36B20|nr:MULTISPECIES: hypothetical protein [Microcystis]MCE2721617.1 hypothetical protein [Anabaena sp. 49628_E55]MCZ8159976.1 hypothetical protein [Microcystis sp. LE19-196.1B]MCZ8272853.1 hypothetical protein [Microcystis sp. LE19-4.1E]MCZ8065348.1 hypothetical protein [Microcystis sp. LE17-20D]WNF13410.1 hypothetical protein RKE53_14950 [Microcystis aeruginosa NRERC-214]